MARSHAVASFDSSCWLCVGQRSSSALSAPILSGYCSSGGSRRRHLLTERRVGRWLVLRWSRAREFHCLERLSGDGRRSCWRHQVALSVLTAYYGMPCCCLSASGGVGARLQVAAVHSGAGEVLDQHPCRVVGRRSCTSAAYSNCPCLTSHSAHFGHFRGSSLLGSCTSCSQRCLDPSGCCWSCSGSLPFTCRLLRATVVDALPSAARIGYWPAANFDWR